MCTDKIVNSAESCICVFVHSADLRFLHLENNLRCRFAHFVHDGFSHICTFAHLCSAHVRKSFACVRKVFYICAFVNSLLQKCANMKICFATGFSLFDGFCQICSKSRKSRNFRKCPENVRKKLTCSWVVHEWFLGQRVWQHRVAKVARICIN